MAVINKQTGYYGFTLDGTSGGLSDEYGRVNRCMISIAYPHQSTGVDFNITKGINDWGAQMGDGSIIPLLNPEVLYVNRDSAIVQFDMQELYASNSPCILVYRSDSAEIKIKNTDSPDSEFKIGHVTGNFAFTTNTYGANSDSDGRVNKIVCTFPFPIQVNSVKFNISNDPSHWGARMGDGSIITLRDPKVISTNNNCAIVVFTMDTMYPSNSPCILVYMSPDAYIHITENNEDVFYPVTDIINVPNTLVSGVETNLSIAKVVPFNASEPIINWEVISGNATINNNRILSKSSGNIKIRGTVVDSINDPNSESGKGDFVKDFTLTSIKNTINILVQPDEEVFLTSDNINYSLTVNASCTSNDIHYQWYKGNSKNIDSFTPIEAETNSSYKIPETEANGSYYYFCKITSPGADDVNSNISNVNIKPRLTGIRIVSSTDRYSITGNYKIEIVPVPENAKLPLFTLSFDNPEIAQVKYNGDDISISITKVGLAKLRAVTIPVDGVQFTDEIVVDVHEYVPVTNIIDVPMEIDTKSPTLLTGKVVPDNASFTDITWQLINVGGTGAVLENGSLLAQNPGTITIRAIINKGYTPYSSFTKDFVVTINKKFVPVADIVLNGFPDEYRVGDRAILSFSALPVDADNRYVNASITSSGGTGAVLLADGSLTATTEGNIQITATISNGLGNRNDFVKVFTINVLPKWIPVENILGIPEIWESVEDPIILQGTVSPLNATKNTIEYTLKSGSAANAVLNGNTITIDYENVTWWTVNPDPKDLVNYTDQYLEMVTDPVIIEARVVDGIRKGEDFVQQIPISIQSPPGPAVHIPLSDISLIFPSIIRAHRPILCQRYIKDPWNATNGPMHIRVIRKDTLQGGIAMGFIPGEESPEYWDEVNHIKMTDEYDWNQEGTYLYPFEDGSFFMEYNIENATSDKRSLLIHKDIDIAPEYIPVSNISNIPSSIAKNSSLNLFGECEGNVEVESVENNNHTETYDLEKPSYSDITWSIVDAGATGATISNGIISFKRSGRCTIKASVENGIMEEYDWYDIHHDENSYTQQFIIDVEDSETVHKNPVVSLTLTNGNVVNVYKESEIYNMSNDLPADSEITVGGKTFKKNSVKEIKFWDDMPSMGTDDTVPITNIEFNSPTDHWNEVNHETSYMPSIQNFNNLTITGRHFAPIPNTEFDQDTRDMFRVDNCWEIDNKCSTFFKPDGSIVQFDNNRNEININEELGIDKFLFDVFDIPNIYYNRDIEKFDNGYINVGNMFDPNNTTRRSFITKDGNLYITRDNSDISPFYMVYKINRYGIIFEYGIGLYPYDNVDHYFYFQESEIVHPSTIYFPYKNVYLMNNNNIAVKGNNDTYDFIKIDTTITEYTGDSITGNYIKLFDPRILGFRGYDYDNKIFYPANNDDDGTDTFAHFATSGVDGYDLLENPISITRKNNTNIAVINGTIYNTSDSGDTIVYIPEKINGVKAGVYDDNSNVLMNNFMVIDKDHTVITPSNATKTFDDINFNFDDNGTGSKMYEFYTNDSDSIIRVITAGTSEGASVLETIVPDGIGWKGQDYRDIDLYTIGSTSSKEILGLNPEDKSIGKVIFSTMYQTSRYNISVDLIGLNLSDNDKNNIQWTINGYTQSKTGFKIGESSLNFWGSSDIVSSKTTGSSVTVSVAPKEKAGSIINVTASYGTKSVTVKLYVFSKYADSYNVTSLSNFARNFTGLIKIDRIPETVTGDGCLRNFLKGCTSFNQQITIHEYVEGDRCLEGFLSDCTSFNKPITIPERVTGYRCLARFLEGCTSFNQPIVIPDNVTGDYCLMRFLSKCTSFNSSITIPDGVSGKQCMDHFLFRCTTYNKPIKLPSSLSGIANLRGFMRDTFKMTSNITVPLSAAENAEGNGLTLVCFKRDDAYDIGVPIVGDGANLFKEKIPNKTSLIPLRNLK